VRRADRIIVLEHGRIVEDGTHESLLAEEGRYAELFHLQAERFAAGLDAEADEDEKEKIR
jgi:ATP-binding cassette subfamily B protein